MRRKFKEHAINEGERMARQCKRLWLHIVGCTPSGDAAITAVIEYAHVRAHTFGLRSTEARAFVNQFMRAWNEGVAEGAAHLFSQRAIDQWSRLIAVHEVFT